MLHWVQEEKTVVPSKFRPYFPESILSRGMFIQSVIFPDACQVHAGNNGPCRSKHLTSQFHVGISISGGIWVGCADRYNIICYEGNQDQKSIFQNIKLWTKHRRLLHSQLGFNCRELCPLRSVPGNVSIDVSVELQRGHLALGALPQAGFGVLLPIEVGVEGLAAPGPVK